MLHKLLAIIRSVFSAPVDAASLRPPTERTGSPPSKGVRPLASSQISLDAAELIQAYVVATANAPAEYTWDRCICYAEVSRYEDGDLRVVGSGCPYLNGTFIPEPTPSSIESYQALERYFQFSENLPNLWAGVAFDIRRDGRYFVSYFYEPCLGDPPDHAEVDRRLDELSLSNI